MAAVHAQGGQVETARPHIRLDRQHEIIERFAAVVGIEDGLVHADGFVRVVERGVDRVFGPLRRRNRCGRGGISRDDGGFGWRGEGGGDYCCLSRGGDRCRGATGEKNRKKKEERKQVN